MNSEDVMSVNGLMQRLNFVMYSLQNMVIFHCRRLLSDISRLEAKVERLEGQLQAKDREIATITRTVRNF